MSRVGKKPIPIPAGVTVKVEGNKVLVKGPQGELSQEISPKEKFLLTIPLPYHQQKSALKHVAWRANMTGLVWL